jgi:hypothetical protein
VNPRFQVLSAVDTVRWGVERKWYPARAPLSVRVQTGTCRIFWPYDGGESARECTGGGGARSLGGCRIELFQRISTRNT